MCFAKTHKLSILSFYTKLKQNVVYDDIKRNYKMKWWTIRQNRIFGLFDSGLYSWGKEHKYT